MILSDLQFRIESHWMFSEISGQRLIYLWLQIFILIIDLQSDLLRQGQTKYELTREI